MGLYITPLSIHTTQNREWDRDRTRTNGLHTHSRSCAVYLNYKVCLHVMFLVLVRYFHYYKICSFYCHQNNKEKKGQSPILSVILTITIGTMLNFNGGNNGHGLKNITCKQTFWVSLKTGSTVDNLLPAPGVIRRNLDAD